MAAIWKDKFVNFGDVDSATFSIVLNGETIYSGVAHRRPNESELLVRVNDICADYLSHHPIAVSGITAAERRLLFYVYDDTSTLIDNFVLVYDWSYDPDWNEDDDGHLWSAMFLTDPVSRRVDNRQILPLSSPQFESPTTAHLYFNDGSTTDEILSVESHGDFNLDFGPEGNSDFDVDIQSADPQDITYWFDLRRYYNLKAVVFEDANGLYDPITYDVVSNCRQWALYYVNAYGGWDTLLIEGGVKEMDTYTRFAHKISYDNSSIMNRGNVNHANEYVKSWEVNTGWLTGEGGQKMHHLLGSTDVYLYDMIDGRMIPVTITDNECTYKTHRNEGNKLVKYTLNIELAQDRVRR